MTAGIARNQSLETVNVPALLPVVACLAGGADSVRCFDDTYSRIPQPDKQKARQHFRQSFVVLDPFLQNGKGNVFHDRDLLLPGHEGSGTSRFKRVTQGTIFPITPHLKRYFSHSSPQNHTEVPEFSEPKCSF